MKIIAFLFCILTPLLMSAQPIVDITLVPTGGQYEVRIRPDDAGFQGVFSSIVFTLRWNEDPDVALGEFTPSSECTSYGLSIFPSGDVTAADGYHYAIFAGFSLQATNLDWTAGQEVLLGTIPDDGQMDMQLINDTWTLAHNGNFYVSLNGANQTGVIYHDITTGMEKITSRDLCASLYPNPTNGTIKLVIDLPASGYLSVSVINMNGEIVHHVLIPANKGMFTHEFDLSDVANGQYMVQTRMGAMRSSVPCIVQH